jgi:hypothetical protein
MDEYSILLAFFENASFPIALLVVLFLAYIKSMPLIKTLLDKQIATQEKQNNILDEISKVLQEVLLIQINTKTRLDEIEKKLRK